MIAVIILVGITVAVGGILSYAFLGQTSTLTQSDSVTPSNMSIIKVGSTAHISANIKNTGNTDVTGMTVLVEVDADTATPGVQAFTVNFNPSTIQPGQSASVRAVIVDETGADISMPSGSQYLVSVNGITADGGSISYPIAIRVR